MDHSADAGRVCQTATGRRQAEGFQRLTDLWTGARHIRHILGMALYRYAVANGLPQSYLGSAGKLRLEAYIKGFAPSASVTDATRSRIFLDADPAEEPNMSMMLRLRFSSRRY
jgi:hypothetical protein